jgi:hypothetical protein
MKIFEHSPEDAIIRYLESCAPEDEIYKCEDDQGNSWLHFYAGRGYPNLHDLILEEFPAIVHSENLHMETPLFSAIAYNNFPLVKKIIAVDESVLSQLDVSGRSPLYVSFQERCSVDICEFLWGFYPGIENFTWYYRNSMASSFEKTKFLLDNVPGIFDTLIGHGGNIVHYTLTFNRSVFLPRVMKYIHEKMGISLFSTPDDVGMVALHHVPNGFGTLLKVVYDIYPGAVYHKDMWGNTPLTYAQCDGDVFATDILEKHPDILELQNIRGETLFMQHTTCPPDFFRIHPASFIIRDKHGNNALHYICSRKNSEWWKFADDIMRAYPYLLFQHNDEGKTPLDNGVSKIGYSKQQRSIERFIAVCLKYVAIPDKYWIFDGVSFDLMASIGHILNRSKDEAARAMVHLPRVDTLVVQNLVIGLDRLEPEICTKILQLVLSH